MSGLLHAVTAPNQSRDRSILLLPRSCESIVRSRLSAAIACRKAKNHKRFICRAPEDGHRCVLATFVLSRSAGSRSQAEIVTSRSCGCLRCSLTSQSSPRQIVGFHVDVLLSGFIPGLLSTHILLSSPSFVIDIMMTETPKLSPSGLPSMLHQESSAPSGESCELLN